MSTDDTTIELWHNKLQVLENAAKESEQILKLHGIPSELWPVLQLLSDPTVYAHIQELLQHVDVPAVQKEIAKARNDILGELLSPCAGGCGKRFKFSELMNINAVGVYGRVCADCHIHLAEREARRIAHRGIKSALTRARAAHLPATLTQNQWEQTCAYFGNRCAYCGSTWYIVEHATPIELGGGTTFSNCLPACYSCNTKKTPKTLEEFVIDNDQNLSLTRALDWLILQGRQRVIGGAGK